MTHVMACIDNSQSSLAVCDYAAWASQRLRAPLTLLHVLDEERYPTTTDFGGNIGLGSKEHLLEKLTMLDTLRAKIALENGQYMLESARSRVLSSGVVSPNLKQRHGHLVESINALQDDIRLLIIGRVGEDSTRSACPIGSQIEAVVRAFHRPILIANGNFKKPKKVMLAFDGSANSQKTVQTLASSPLCTGLSLHIVMAGEDSPENQNRLDRARGNLAASGLQVQAELRKGEVEVVLQAYQTEHAIDLLVMGAYGHSRIRQFLVGSTTSMMLRTTTLPVLLIR